ncbi:MULTISPECIES: helix-turn-helix transcriptional regulator [Arthrobacter]|nr:MULTISPECIES: helix-turn-helix transcriptional regulator [Arthrobacter]
MPQRKQNPSGPFARASSAEVRATMARKRVSAAKLAAKAEMSPSYLSTRLRDDLPFTLNDIEAICKALEEDLDALLHTAVQNAAIPE